jgi:hypothetical protein
VALTATPSELARLTVRVAEFPAGCQGAMRGVQVRLQPGGATQTTSLADGTAVFIVAPGSYTVSVLQGCNPFGCWADRVVEVTAAGQFVTLCPLSREATPTPTPTPTATATPSTVGGLGTKTTQVHAFNLSSGAPLAGAGVDVSGARLDQTVNGESDDSGDFAFTIFLRDSDTILVVVSAPGFAERRRGYRGLDLWRNDQTLQVGLIPDGLCAGDCDGDGVIDVGELVRAVGFALGDGNTAGCPLADQDGDGRVAVNDIVASVQRALDGCPAG